MKLIHSAITSPIFELIHSYELDISLGNDINQDHFPLRIELFRSLTSQNLFRYRAWRGEFFRIQSTFPQDESGSAIHLPSDETILVAFSQPHFGPSDDFYADDFNKALSIVMEQLGKALEHISSESLRIE